MRLYSHEGFIWTQCPLCGSFYEEGREHVCAPSPTLPPPVLTCPHCGEPYVARREHDCIHPYPPSPAFLPEHVHEVQNDN